MPKPPHNKKQSFGQVLKNIETSMMTDLSNAALSSSMQEEATCIFTPSEEEPSQAAFSARVADSRVYHDTETQSAPTYSYQQAIQSLLPKETSMKLTSKERIEREGIEDHNGMVLMIQKLLDDAKRRRDQR